MAERSRFWDGSTVGDAVSITDNEFMDRFWRAILNGTGNQGVLRGWLNELAVTNGGGLNAAVATGGAVCYGGWFESDAAETVAVPNNSTVYVIVSRDWAAQTIRLTHDGGAGLTQNDGTQYDIPLAQVTAAGGAITLITDARDYCEMSMVFQDGSIIDDSIQADAVTTIKMENQTRWITRGLNQFYPDSPHPATLSATTVINYAWEPYRPFWAFTTGVSDAVWCTLQAPADMVGANLSVYAWTSMPDAWWAGNSGTVRWAFSAWVAGDGDVLTNQTGAASVVYAHLTAPVYYSTPVAPPYPSYFNDSVKWRYSQRDLIGTIPASAGDIVHVQFYRDGAHGDDNWGTSSAMFMLEFSYEADS